LIVRVNKTSSDNVTQQDILHDKVVMYLNVIDLMHCARQLDNHQGVSSKQQLQTSFSEQLIKPNEVTSH